MIYMKSKPGENRRLAAHILQRATAFTKGSDGSRVRMERPTVVQFFVLTFLLWKTVAAESSLGSAEVSTESLVGLSTAIPLVLHCGRPKGF